MSQDDDKSEDSYRNEPSNPQVFTPQSGSELSRTTTYGDTPPKSDANEECQQGHQDGKGVGNSVETTLPLPNESDISKGPKATETAPMKKALDQEHAKELVLEAILENGEPDIDGNHDEVRNNVFSCARQHMSEASSLLKYLNSLEATVLNLQSKLKSADTAGTPETVNAVVGLPGQLSYDGDFGKSVESVPNVTPNQDGAQLVSDVATTLAPAPFDPFDPLSSYNSHYAPGPLGSSYPYPSGLEPHAMTSDSTLDDSGGAKAGCPCTGCKEKRTNALDENVWKLETKRLIQTVDQYDTPQIQDDNSDRGDRSRKKRTSEYVLTTLRSYNKEGIHTETALEIGSPKLIEVLIEVIGSYPGDSFKGLSADKVKISEPYIMLFHNRKKLQGALPELKGLKHDHLKLLLEFLKTEMPIASQKLDELDRGECTKIGYNEVWLLYPPDTIIYTFEDQDWCASEVQTLRGFTKMSSGLWSALHIDGFGRAFDSFGNSLVAITRNFTLAPYVGEEVISNLRPLPSGFSMSEEHIKKDLMARGLQYWNFRAKGHCREYTGSAWVKAWEGDTVRVMIDYATSSRNAMSSYNSMDLDPTYGAVGDPTYGAISDPYAPPPPVPTGPGTNPVSYPNCNCSICRGRRNEASKASPRNGSENNDHDVNEGDLILCPAEVYAFSLPGKEWRTVKIRELRDIKFDEDALQKKLVIEKNYKKVVTAMVKSYLSKEPTFTDFIKGKGRGLVVLLHGSPGTGKTLTAECVAEKERRPLYMVTCGDLGTDPATMETKLKETFERAINWNAVLLLDEADVFLQERDIHDLARNALVSVFLRQLEYFDGILFLTTNRPGSLDEAFQSRIHITLGLPDLTRENQLKVWALFIHDLDISKDKQLKLMQYVGERVLKEEPNVDGTVKANWLNGRQIRNCVRAAMALATQEGVPISKEHIQAVVDIGRKFTDYMVAINRMNQQQLAFARGTRGPTGN